MAAISPTVTKLSKGMLGITWTPVTEADTCVAVDLSAYGSPKSQVMSVDGTEGTSPTFNLQNSADNSQFVDSKDDAGASQSLSALGAIVTKDVGRYVRGAVTGGTSVSVTISVAVMV